MKPGDIVRNWSAGKDNPNRCFVVTQVTPRHVHGINRKADPLLIDRGFGASRDAHLEVIGSIDLSPLDRALEEHADKDCR